MSPFINPPHQITRAILGKVDASFNKASDSVGIKEHKYVQKRIKRTTQTLLTYASDWEVTLASKAIFIFRTYSKFSIFSENCNKNHHDSISDTCLDCGGAPETRSFYNECIKKEIFWKKHTNGRLNNRHSCSRFLLAGLYYLCNPFNIIPDHVVGIGFVDDAHVMNKCIKYLKINHPEIFYHEES